MRLLKQETGLSLIETVAASVILVTALLTIIGALSNSHNLVFWGRDNIVANDLLTQAVEETKHTPFQSLYSKTENNYRGSKFTLIQTVYDTSPYNSRFRKVGLILKDGTGIRNSITFILYEKGI